MKSVFLLLLLISSVACAENAPDANSRDQWQKRWWLEKAVRVLRGGTGILPSDDVARWMRLPESELVNQLMADPRFSDMALDFNLMFLGFRIGQLHGPTGSYISHVYDFPSALDSAREVLRHGDYFRLFELSEPIFLEEAKVARLPSDDPGKSDLELDRERIKKFEAGFRDIIAWTKNDPTATPRKACKRFDDHVGGGFEEPLVRMGLSPEFIMFGIKLNPNWELGFTNRLQVSLCTSTTTKIGEITARLERIYVYYDRLLNQLLSLVEKKYSPKRVDEIVTFDPSKLGIDVSMMSYGYRQRLALPNSITNLNRKRAAYVLKHYFCDDLNPIGLESPKTPLSGPHGSQTTCYACHYKLDPMAGYFRNHGIAFGDFSGSEIIQYDDLSEGRLKELQKHWKGSPGSGRDWEIGYIRSVSDESVNTYGSSLEDLFSLFRKAPEVKRCIVRRLYEYVVSDQQIVDGGYIDYLTGEFTKRAETNSSDAFRWVVGQLVMSQAFRQPDPDPRTCYDFQPGSTPSTRPPCRVASILEKNCYKCHNSAQHWGHLDLTQWHALPGGGHDFLHENPSGEKISMAETMRRIVDRLSTPDTRKRMPANGLFMSSQDRQDLYLWAEQMAKGEK